MDHAPGPIIAAVPPRNDNPGLRRFAPNTIDCHRTCMRQKRGKDRGTVNKSSETVPILHPPGTVSILLGASVGIDCRR